MENKQKILTVCNSRSGYPQVLIAGAWVGDCGFDQGDQVTITSPKKGILVVLDTMPAEIWYPQKQVKRLEAEIERLKMELAEAHWESDIKRIRHDLKMAELDLAAMKAMQNMKA